ncbi:hypothetical protein NZ043_27340 [Paenibacillus sp. FSL k6-2145]|uniref:hypothetical protein n=1 Tax=Paenibacillus sp. FSL k6-2145 TaxID=2976834 RepID=UPI0030D9CF26
MKKILKHSDWLFLSIVILGYIAITIEIVFTGEQSIVEKRDLYRMMASTNITLALGFAAILIAVVALNNKVLIDAAWKKSLTVGITAYILFMLLNSIQLMLSYSNIYIELAVMKNVFVVSNICFALSLVSAFSLMKRVIMRVEK